MGILKAITLSPMSSKTFNSSRRSEPSLLVLTIRELDKYNTREEGSVVPNVANARDSQHWCKEDETQR